VNIIAHTANRPRKVRGIRQDPFNEHTIATFSDSPLEPIKIWDIRKGSYMKPKMTIFPHEQFSQYDSSGNVSNNIATTPVSSQSTVIDIAWSNSRANLLAVATNQQKSIAFYTTYKNPPDATTRVPIHTIAVQDYVKSISWQSAHCIENKYLSNVNSTNSIAVNNDSKNEVKQPLNPNDSVSNKNNDTNNNNNFNNNDSSGNNNDNNNQKEKYETLSNHRLLVATNSGYCDLQVIESIGISNGKHLILSASGHKITSTNTQESGGLNENFKNLMDKLRDLEERQNNYVCHF
jgi:hypothetical protein